MIFSARFHIPFLQAELRGPIVNMSWITSCCTNPNNEDQQETSHWSPTEDSTTTLKNYFMETLSEDDDQLIVPSQTSRKRNRNEDNADDQSVAKFFSDAKRSKKQKNVSSTVSSLCEGGVSCISTGVDDKSGATHLIKMDVFDLKKISGIPLDEHWKYADYRVKYYSKGEKNEIFQKSKQLLFNVCKDVSESKEFKKYFFKK